MPLCVHTHVVRSTVTRFHGKRAPRTRGNCRTVTPTSRLIDGEIVIVDLGGEEADLFIFLLPREECVRLYARLELFLFRLRDISAYVEDTNHGNVAKRINRVSRSVAIELRDVALIRELQ